MRLSRWLMLSRTVLALGVRSIVRVGLYRARLRTGTHPVQRLQGGAAARAPFFRAPTTLSSLTPPTFDATGGLGFGWIPVSGRRVPEWHRNLLTNRLATGALHPWWVLTDFGDGAGDIKGIWELSRLDWAVTFAQLAATGDMDALVALNEWLDSWSEANPPYRGQNWKCAQEASIRVLHLAVSAMVLDQAAEPCESLVALVRAHALRITPTIAYAQGQDNNHGTSEAAALFVAGSWLASRGVPQAQVWEQLGRQLLAERVAHLVSNDGTFSQYSVNYHRLVLDTLSIAECWRRHLALPAFAPVMLHRAAVATEWLRSLVDPLAGDAPNVGANDGANLLRLTDAGYRDYRPSVQLASALFTNCNAYPASAQARLHLQWMRVDLPVQPAAARVSCRFDEGGFAVLLRDHTMALLRYPRFRFRPAHTDALHVDLWHGDRCLLRDGGTFSYSADTPTLDSFAGVAGHNVIQFDGHQQMPRLGRFLWGDWVRTAARGALDERRDSVRFWAAYVDRHGASHRRDLELSATRLRVTDTLAGFTDCAVLRWRLRPDTWRLHGSSAVSETMRVSVTASVPVAEVALTEGCESLFYGQQSPIPVLAVTFRSAATVVTDVEWAA